MEAKRDQVILQNITNSRILADFSMMYVKPKGLIAVEKMKLSQLTAMNGNYRHCPITTSETVDILLCRTRTKIDMGFEDLSSYPDFIFDENLRVGLTLGYLRFPVKESLVELGPGKGNEAFYSPIMASRLHGELSRFAADLSHSSPHKIVLYKYIDKSTIDQYCERCNVSGLRELVAEEMPFII